MKRSDLKKRANPLDIGYKLIVLCTFNLRPVSRGNISNNPEIIKLYKKQRNYAVNLSRKVKTDYFQKHIPHGASLKAFGNFTSHFFQIKQQILTIKLYW